MINKRTVGNGYEEIAVEYLEGLGYKIEERNFRCRSGEIDIIARHEGYLVFVEVKYRSTTKKGTPEESINWRKQQTISRVADFYIYSHGLRADRPYRFDAVLIQGADIRVIKNAFDHA